MYDYYFFDMDGTLIQSEYGVSDGIMYALERFDINIEDRASLRKCLGPPLYYSFTEFFGMNDADANRAIEIYREYYIREGIYASPLYEGLYDTLRELFERGKKLAVVTSKPINMARIVLEHNDIAGFFSAVAAPTEDESAEVKKSDLIKRAMQELNADDRSKVVMIGDRRFDMEGAVGAGVDAAGALYGYGSREELETSGAAYIIMTPPDILDL